MPPEAATTPDSGSDSVRTSISLDDAANLDIWEPDAATPDIADGQQSQIEPDEAGDGQESEDINAPDIGDDVNEDDGAGEQASTPEPADDITITIGNEKLTLGELKKGHLREGDYTRHKQRVAHKERELEGLADTVNQSVYKIADFLARQVPEEPDAQMAISDPGRYVREMAMHNQAMTQLSSIFASSKEVGNVASALTSEQHNAYLSNEAEKLATVFPQLRDTGEKDKFFQATFDTARQLGYTDQELDGVTDHRLFKLAYYARIGMRAEKARTTAMGKVQNVPPIAPNKRPQGNNSSRTKANQDAMRRLAKSGSIDDAMSIDFD